MNQYNNNLSAAGYGQITSVNNVPNNYSSRMVVDNSFVNGTNNMNVNPSHSMYYHDSKNYYNNIAPNMSNAPIMQDPTMDSYALPAYHNIQRQPNVNDAYYDPNQMSIDPFSAVGAGGTDDMHVRLNQLAFDNENFFDPNRMPLDPFASFAAADTTRQMNHTNYGVGGNENYYHNDATMRTIASNVNGSNNATMDTYSSMVFPVQDQLCNTVGGNHFDQDQIPQCPPYMDITPATSVNDNALLMNNVDECQRQNIIEPCLPSIPNIENVMPSPAEMVDSSTSDILRNTLLSNNVVQNELPPRNESSRTESLRKESPPPVLPVVAQPTESEILATRESAVNEKDTNTLIPEVDSIPNIRESTPVTPEILVTSKSKSSPTNTNETSVENTNGDASPHAISLVELPEETFNNYDFIGGGGDESEDPLEIPIESDKEGVRKKSTESFDAAPAIDENPKSASPVPRCSPAAPDETPIVADSTVDEADALVDQQPSSPIRETVEIESNESGGDGDDSRDLVCGSCRKTFDDETELESHRLIRKTYYKCGRCSARFSSECAYNGHQLERHGCNEKEKEVDDVDEDDVDAAEAQEGGDDAPSDERTSFPCEYCGYVYTTKYSLIRHVKNNTVVPASSRSRQSTKPFGCDKCEQTYAAKCALMKHTRAEHPFEVVPNKMSYVTYAGGATANAAGGKSPDVNQGPVFSTVRTLQPISTPSVHYPPSLKTNRCRCRFCSRTFSSAFCRDQHERQTHADQPPLSCHICDQPFMYWLSLEEHLKKHERVKNEFRCDVCLRSFASRRNLRRHRALHERGNHFWSNSSLTITASPYVTQQSKAAPAQPPKPPPTANSITVRSVVQPPPPSSSNSNVLTPPARPMTYAELNKLERRYKQPFTCEFCGKTFPYKVNYIEHYLTHTGERPFKCDVCNRGFIRERPMQEHRAQHGYDDVTAAEQQRKAPPARDTEAELQTLMWQTEQGRRITRGTLAAVFKSEESSSTPPESSLRGAVDDDNSNNEIDLDLVKTEPIEFAEATYDSSPPPPPPQPQPPPLLRSTPSLTISAVPKSTSASTPSSSVYNNVLRTRNVQITPQPSTPRIPAVAAPPKRDNFVPPPKRESQAPIITRHGVEPPDYTHLIPPELREKFSRTPIVSLLNLNASRITGTVHVCSLCDKFFPLYTSLVGHKKTCAYLSRKRAERALEVQKQLENEKALSRLTSSLNSQSVTIFPTKQPAVSILPASNRSSSAAAATSLSSSAAVSILPASIAKSSAVSIFPTNAAARQPPPPPQPQPPYVSGPRGRVREMREKTFLIGNIEHRIVIEGGERYFECGRCGKRFGRKWNLTQHNRVHMKPEKAYRCNPCGASFPSKTHLVIHNCAQGGGREQTAAQTGGGSTPGTSWTMFAPKSSKGAPQTISVGGGSGSVNLASLIQQYVKDARVNSSASSQQQQDGDAESDFDESIFEPQCIVNAGNSPIDQNYYEDEKEVMANSMIEPTSPQLHHFLEMDSGDDGGDGGKVMENGYEAEANDDEYYDNGEEANDSDANDEGSDDGTAVMIRGSNLVCAQCNSSFKQREELFRHYWRQHRHEKSFKCYYCSKVFQKRKYLTRHARLSHMRLDNYLCKYCKKTFRTNTQLVSHERVHTGEKPYQCDQCDKSFRVAQQLTLHYRFHTGEKPYPCGFCGEPFARQDYLQRHLKHCPDNPAADQEMIRDDGFDAN